MPTRRSRDIEKAHSTREFVAKLRRFADALERHRTRSADLFARICRANWIGAGEIAEVGLAR